MAAWCSLSYVTRAVHVSTSQSRSNPSRENSGVRMLWPAVAAALSLTVSGEISSISSRSWCQNSNQIQINHTRRGISFTNEILL